MKKIGLVLAAIIAILVVVIGKLAHDKFTVELPNYSPIQNVVWLDQNWTAEQRNWFHHADQGTLTFGIPYEWFVALEQPALSFTTPGRLSDPQYLDRFGFVSLNTNPDKPELPIGFARGGPLRNANGVRWQNPQTKMDMTGLGLTCAACHTGRLTYHETTVLVDGAPALTNLTKFEKGIGLSLLYTRYWPFRFD